MALTGLAGGSASESTLRPRLRDAVLKVQPEKLKSASAHPGVKNPRGGLSSNCGLNRQEATSESTTEGRLRSLADTSAWHEGSSRSPPLLQFLFT